jgi:DNA-binding transcriptional regulator YhcF (GntR family)
MSITLMTLAWKMDMATHAKMVLLALCDNANDQGECYPSVSMLAEKCSMAERSVQKHISDMESAGIVARGYRNGRSTLYQINPRKLCTPAPNAPLHQMHPTPATGAPTPPQLVHPTPATGAPITIIEPSIEPSSKHKRRAKPASDDFCVESALLAEGVLPQTAKDWLAFRKTKRAAVSKTVVETFVREAAKAGMTLEAVLSLCPMRGWTGFEADWVLRSPRGGGETRFDATSHVNRNRPGQQ